MFTARYVLGIKGDYISSLRLTQTLSPSQKHSVCSVQGNVLARKKHEYVLWAD